MSECPVCGKEFDNLYYAFNSNLRKAKTYCSYECYYKALKIRARENYYKTHPKINEVYTCECCGKEFERHRRDYIYCSHSCESKVRNMKNRTYKTTYTRVCPVCGKEFTTNRKNKKYCNLYCGARANQKKHYYAHREEILSKYHGDMPNVCCLCGKEIPNKYTVCSECAKKSKIKFEKKKIYEENQ